MGTKVRIPPEQSTHGCSLHPVDHPPTPPHPTQAKTPAEQLAKRGEEKRGREKENGEERSRGLERRRGEEMDGMVWGGEYCRLACTVSRPAQSSTDLHSCDPQIGQLLRMHLSIRTQGDREQTHSMHRSGQR